MKLHLIFPNYYPDTSAAVNRLNVYLKLLKQNNIECNLFSLSKEKNNKNFVYKPKISKGNFFKRAFEELKFSFELVKKARRKNGVYYLTIPSMFLAPIGLMLKGKKIIDIRDIQWEYLNNRVIKNILRFITINSIKKYNFVIVTNNYEYEYFKKYEIEPVLIYNGIEEEKFKRIVLLNYKMKNEVTYIGNIGIAQNIMTLVKVAEELPEIKFNIIGDGAEFEKIKNYIKSKNLRNINLPGKLSWNEILKYYEKSKILFAQLGDEFKTAMPSKLYEYASTGLPIVYGGSGEAVNFVKKLENSYVFKSEDYKECKKYILKLINKDIKISQKNREFIEQNFIREKNAKKLIEILRNL